MKNTTSNTYNLLRILVSAFLAVGLLGSTGAPAALGAGTEIPQATGVGELSVNDEETSEGLGQSQRAATALDAPSSPSMSGRNPAWAVPIDRPSLKNFYKVTDNLYRGAQPTAEGFRELEKMGIKTVVNLRSFHSDRDKLKGTSLGYVHIYSKAFHAEDEDVTAFLKTVLDESEGPYFVHCHHGADRTGMMCAVYRIVVQDWTRDEAIEEMTQGGYDFHTIWTNLVRYIQKLDMDKIKKEAGLQVPSEPTPL